MNPTLTLPGYRLANTFHITQTDLVRFWVIASITASIIGVTYVSMAAGYGSIVPQLFYFPIIYATYFYPSRGIYVAGCCAVSYLLVSVYFITPNPFVVGGVVFQALLFIGIAIVSSYIVKQREVLQIAVPEDDAVAVRVMIAAGENERVEFKFKALWSTRLSKVESDASDSAEVRKYRTNASKFIIARSIAGFLNSSGGDLIIGIEEDRVKNVISVVGIDDDYSRLLEKDRNPDGYRRMLIDSVIRRYIPEIYETASRFIRITFPVISEKTLCHVHITPADKPVFVDTGKEEFFFIRVDASTRNISGKTLTGYILTRFTGF
jgi:uncharacterized protein YaaQ